MLKNTTKKAPYRVSAISGGRSRWATDSWAYCPTPSSPKIGSIRITVPPTTAPKSSPNSVTTGIRQARSVCRTSTREGDPGQEQMGCPPGRVLCERHVAAGRDPGEHRPGVVLVGEQVEHHRTQP